MSHKKLRPFIVKVSVLGYFPLLVKERVPLELVPIFLSKHSRSSFPFIIQYPFLSDFPIQFLFLYPFPFPFQKERRSRTGTTPNTDCTTYNVRSTIAYTILYYSIVSIPPF